MQKEVCKKYGVIYSPPSLEMKVGLSLNLTGIVYPINGLRHPIKDETTGWYIWAGEFSDDPNFFLPIHVKHLVEMCPHVIKYLALPPGWRFLVADQYEDVWEDRDQLKID